MSVFYNTFFARWQLILFLKKNPFKREKKLFDEVVYFSNLKGFLKYET